MQSGRVGDDAADRRGVPRAEPWERLDGLGSWQDLVLPPPALEQLKAVPAQFGERFWLTSAASLGSLAADGKRGLLLLFDGPGGTGKTMAARALAGALHLPVLEADLEAMFARGRGEATQLVARLFATAQRLGAVLVLDRADEVLRAASAGATPGIAGMAAIDVRDLLRRSEAHPGVVIFPTTIADTLRPALLQRFDGVVAFQSPDRPARAEIWRRSLPRGARVHDDDIAFLARSFSLTGKQIADCCRQGERFALRSGRALLLADIADALERSPEMAARASPGALAELRRLAGVAAASPESVMPAAESEPEPVVEPEPEAAAEPEPEAATEPEPEAATEPEPEPVAEPEPEPADTEPSPMVAEPEPLGAMATADALIVPKPGGRRRSARVPRGAATPAGTQFTARGFVAVALLGALGAVVLGLSASEPPTRTQTTTTSVTTAAGYRTAAVGPVHFSYPTTWRARPAGTLTPGPGLTFTRAVTLSSGGASGGLLTIGTTSSRGPGTPLPTQFISAELTGTPAAQEVSLGSHRFYRVIDPLLALGARSESVFALASGTGAVVALCQTRTQTFLAQCEQTLGTVSAPPPRVLAAKPSAAKLAYARALNVIIVRLDAARTLGARALAASRVALTEADAARALGLAHADAADSVAALSAGPATAANTALVAALRRVSLAYIHLGDAARVVAPVTYTADRKVVDAANADLAAALARLQSLGYRVS